MNARIDYGTAPLDGLPAAVTICEVGPRDGLQNEAAAVPVAVKAEFVERLVDAGHTLVEVTSLVHPKWIPQLADAEDLLRRLPDPRRGALSGAGPERAGPGPGAGARACATSRCSAASPSPSRGGT